MQHGPGGGGPFFRYMAFSVAAPADVDTDALTRAAVAELVALTQARPELAPTDQRRHMVRWVNAHLDRADLDVIEKRTAIAAVVMGQCFRSTKLLDLWMSYPAATNLSVLGTDEARLEHGDGRIETLPRIVESNEELRRNIIELATAAGSHAGEIWDPARPEFEIIMGDGTRVTAIDWVSQKPFVTLRRPTYAAVTLGDLVANQTMTPQCARFLAAAVRARLRILISGSMNSGKTVLLRALSAALPKTDAVMVAESQPELRLEFADVYPDFVVSLAARRSRSNERYDVSVRSLVERIQRMTPSVVILGEVRGDESVALAAALGQGYAVMSTIHADSAVGAVENAAMYYEEATGTTRDAALARLARGVDLAVFMGRDEKNGRIVAEVAAINGLTEAGDVDVNMLFSYEPEGLVRTPVPVPTPWKRRLRVVGYDPK